MSRPKKTRNKTSNVVPMSPESAESVAVAEAEPETPFDQSPPANPAKTTPPPTPKAKRPSFFARVKLIPKADWGTRVFIYVYCWEPICNLKMGGENKYLVRLSEPILDEQPLMVDYGSGKYHLKLVNRKPGSGEGEMVDTTEIEIYNPKYPPKIPRSVWMNDPRNERWAALLPKEEPVVPPTGLNTLTDAFKTFGEIRRDLKEEMAPPPGAVPAPVGDPMGNALSMVQTIMAMKADNPMVEIMKIQLQSVNDQAERARDREAALQKEMREMILKMSEHNTNGGGEKRFGLREAIGELKEFLPAIKEFLPQAVESARASRSSWLDVARDVAPGVIDWGGKIALALASRMPPPPPVQQNGQPRPQLAATANGAQPQQQPQAPPQEPPAFVRFLGQPFVFDGFQRYFRGYKEGNNTGADFAEWVNDGGGEVPLKEGRAMGSTGIMQMLKQSPAWFLFKDDEAKLTAFVDETLAWAPPVEDPDDGEDDDDDDVVDLTKKGV